MNPKTCSKFHIGKNLLDSFPIQNGLKQGDTVSPFISNLGLQYAISKVQENQEEMEQNTSVPGLC